MEEESDKMTTTTTVLAINGGEPEVKEHKQELFKWPIVTQEDEDAVLEVLRNGSMSGRDITCQLEMEFAHWQGTKYALGHNNGTAALHGAMFGCKVGVGDEIICPSVTYWASALPALSLGASVVFADILPETLDIDPEDIEHRITEHTKAIVVVHYGGMPADMDSIMDIAERHNVKVIEDASHAHGALYKGRKVGGIGHVGAFSCMSGKSLAWGEAGILVTDDREIHERAIAFGHYARHSDETLTIPELKQFARLPLGGYKYRMNQTCAAMGRVQLKHYDKRVEEIQKALNYFWDQLEGVPGIRAHRPPKDSGSTMGGWYNARGLYHKEELDGLPIAKFCEAVRAEGVRTCSPGCNFPLHTHPLLRDCDVYGHGRPTINAHTTRDNRQPLGSLPVSERILEIVFSVPWFKHYEPEAIKQYSDAFRKVCENADTIDRDM